MDTELVLSILAVIGGALVAFAWAFQALQAVTTLMVRDISYMYLRIYMISFVTFIAYVAYREDYVLLIPGVITGFFTLIVIMVKFFPQFSACRLKRVNVYLKNKPFITRILELGNHMSNDAPATCPDRKTSVLWWKNPFCGGKKKTDKIEEATQIKT